MSEYLAKGTRGGERMTIGGPFGTFYLRPVVRPILMIAGGTGLAPMLSMLSQLESELESCMRPIHLVYGAGSADDLIATDDLERFVAGKLPFTFERVVAQAGEGWSGAIGLVTDLLRRELVNEGNCDAYLCGPPGMIDSATRWLAGVGVPPSFIHAEKFVPT